MIIKKTQGALYQKKGGGGLYKCQTNKIKTREIATFQETFTG